MEDCDFPLLPSLLPGMLSNRDFPREDEIHGVVRSPWTNIREPAAYSISSSSGRTRFSSASPKPPNMLCLQRNSLLTVHSDMPHDTPASCGAQGHVKHAIPVHG